MKLKKLFPVLCLTSGLFYSQTTVAKTIFAGSFVGLGVDGVSKNVSVNYPRRGSHGICGIELKSDVIVLNKDVWRRLADLFEVKESYDGAVPKIVDAVIESAYSPTLKYLFTVDNSDYGKMTFTAKNGRTLTQAIDEVFGTEPYSAQLIAVTTSCDSLSAIGKY